MTNPTSTAGRQLGRQKLRATPFSVIGAAVILLLLLSEFVVTSNFLHRGSLSVLTPLIGVMVIVAIGQAIVMGTGGIDLSVTATINLVGSIVLKQSLERNDRLFGALVLCLVSCIVIGLINGVLIEGLRLNALVVTLAVGELVTGYTNIYRGQVLNFTNVPNNLASVAGKSIGGVSYLLLASVAAALIASFFLHRVVAGRRLVASSAAPGTALLVGLRANGYRIFAYVLASCAYGVGGVLAAGQLRTPDLTLGSPYMLTSIAAVVLGGATLTGGRISPLATLLGAAFITILDYDLQVEGYSAGINLLVQGVVLIFALSLGYGIKNLSRLGQQLTRAGPRDVEIPEPTTV